MTCKPLWLALPMILVAACTSVELGEGGGKTHRYLGFVEVTLPETRGQLRAWQIKSVGIAAEDGIMLGWREQEQVLVPLKEPDGEAMPHEAPCSLVVVIRSDAEAKHAREILSGLDGENICLTSFQ
ncbi:hypothetical protein [Kordiimonas sp.]|uniref:hypothetical protein n=1 Tax=Kordiimonas sp. TaxID=1970157 RepID=UPI003A8D41B6